MGMVYRYVSREVSPVASESFNEVAEGTRGGVETLAHAFGRGISAAVGAAQGVAEQDEGLICARCEAKSPPDSNYCNQCGIAFEANICQTCGSDNQPRARFCTECGGKIDT
jgi:ribosomal protein L40E